jgi:hypothetical protein
MVSLRDDVCAIMEMRFALSVPPAKVSKSKRLVNWLTELMSIHLKELITQRGNEPSLPDNVNPGGTEEKGGRWSRGLRLSKRSCARVKGRRCRQKSYRV